MHAVLCVYTCKYKYIHLKVCVHMKKEIASFHNIIQVCHLLDFVHLVIVFDNVPGFQKVFMNGDAS